MKAEKNHADAFEYKVLLLPHRTFPETENSLNEIGRDGWELAALDNERWIFKRKKTNGGK